jgi:site-specific recombinase XerD
MLEYYHRCPERRAAWERNVLAPFLEEAAGRYRGWGYQYKYAQAGLRFMTGFGDWLQENRIPVDQVAEAQVQSFLDQFMPQPHEAFVHKRIQVSAAVHFVLTLIREKHPLTLTQSLAQAEIGKYAEHLRRNRGLAAGTIAHHRQCLEEFLTACFGQGEVRLEEITAARVHAYVETIPRTSRNSKRRRVCSTLRGYFRFLQLQGTPTEYLQTIIPLVPTSRATLSPKVLTPPELQLLLHSMDCTRPTGKRDYAAVLCMIDLGMRVGDVARLSLDDIDWREGAVVVANRKRGRPYRLPLPKRLGQALADYLADGRPSSERREVFVRHAPPRGITTTATALKLAIRSAWKRAGLQDRFSGTHILRHTAATRMKQQGIALKSIADVLGHHSLQTTALYAQVDLPALRRTAQSWPEGQQ